MPRLSSLLGRTSLEGLTLVATVSVQHSYGLESSVLLALLGGAAFDSGRPFFPADIAQALAAVPRPRALVTTPFHLKTLLRSGVDHEVRQLVRGLEPAEDLIAVAEEIGADFIVIGLRRRTPVGKLILGSNAQRILLDAPCPVLAVKADA